MAPVSPILHLGGEIGQLFIGADIAGQLGIDQADRAGIDVVARIFERDRGHPPFIVDESVADLRRAHGHHPGRAPIIEDIGEETAIHEQAVRLPGQHRAPSAIGMTKPEGRLARVDAGPIQVELEFRLVRFPGNLAVGLHTQPRLTHAEDGLAVAAELPFGGRDLRRAQRRVPIGIDAVEILNHVELPEAIDLEDDGRLWDAVRR